MPPEDAAPLVLVLANGADRPPLRVCVVSEPGGWTPGPHVVVESGNHLELTERELEWLVRDAAPKALAALRDGRRPGGPSAPAPPSSSEPPAAARHGALVAGQGDPDRPEPAQPSIEETDDGR